MDVDSFDLCVARISDSAFDGRNVLVLESNLRLVNLRVVVKLRLTGRVDDDVWQIDCFMILNVVVITWQWNAVLCEFKHKQAVQ